MVTVDPKGDGIALLCTSIVFLVIAWLTFVARVAVRVWRKALGLDDHAMAIGLVLFTITASLCIACSFYGSGQRADVLPASTKMMGIKMKFRVKASVAVILGMGAVASCATIVRLKYLSLYNNPAEFMFGTGKIGLWSIVEEGLGISAGSLPALRPVLSLPFFRTGSTDDSYNAASAGHVYNKPRTGRFSRSTDVRLDTFHQIPDDRDRDVDSQKNIMKETQFTMTSEPSETPAVDWERIQALGWKTNKFTTQG
ncbi:hypothetical protein IFR05_002144 [Cadophora sp. M221]|nr:hypothetical protein IFR05_002144 [Cadophora sp. M221]